VAKFESTERQRWESALKAKGEQRLRAGSHANLRAGKGIAPNKAAGSKGGIRRQGSKRG